jgi:hypothetical protein
VGTDSELTKFKKLWRESLSESARDFWRALFLSDTTQAEIRKQILTKLKVSLTYDKQLNQFRKWVAEQDGRDLEAERMKDDERRLTEEHGKDWSTDKIREEVFRRSYARTLATGEFGLGLATAKVDLKQQAQKFNEAKFKESLRTKLETALNALAEHIKGNPKAKAAYEEFRSAIAETTK